MIARAVSLSLMLPVVSVAGQAQALSCIRPDPISSFATANASAAQYLVLTGELTAPGDGQTADAPVSALGQLTGFGLTPDGFTAPFDGDVVLQVTCAGPWCGAMPVSGPIVAFARVDGTTPVIEADACGAWLFSDPDAATLDRLTTCLVMGQCPAP